MGCIQSFNMCKNVTQFEICMTHYLLELDSGVQKATLLESSCIKEDKGALQHTFNQRC